MNKMIKENMPTILTGAGIALFVASGVTAWFAGKKAEKEIENLDKEDPKYNHKKWLVRAKYAAGPVALAGLGAAAEITANEMNLQTITTIASVAIAAEAKAEKHEEKIKQKIKEKLGIDDKQADEIVKEAKDEVRDEKLIKQVKYGDYVIMGEKTEHNNLLFAEPTSEGFYLFWGNIEDVRRAEKMTIRDCLPERGYSDSFSGDHPMMVKKDKILLDDWLTNLDHCCDNFKISSVFYGEDTGWDDPSDFSIDFEEIVEYDDDKCTPGSGKVVTKINFMHDPRVLGYDMY